VRAGDDGLNLAEAEAWPRLGFEPSPRLARFGVSGPSSRCRVQQIAASVRARLHGQHLCEEARALSSWRERSPAGCWGRERLNRRSGHRASLLGCRAFSPGPRALLGEAKRTHDRRQPAESTGPNATMASPWSTPRAGWWPSAVSATPSTALPCWSRCSLTPGTEAMRTASSASIERRSTGENRWRDPADQFTQSVDQVVGVCAAAAWPSRQQMFPGCGLRCVNMGN
jgi:hypothetical protein